MPGLERVRALLIAARDLVPNRPYVRDIVRRKVVELDWALALAAGAALEATAYRAGRAPSEPAVRVAPGEALDVTVALSVAGGSAPGG